MLKEVKVMRSGNSDVVTLPSKWKRDNGIATGDVLLVVEMEDGSISFRKKIRRQEIPSLSKKLEALRKTVGSKPIVGGWSDEDVREMLHDRR